MQSSPASESSESQQPSPSEAEQRLGIELGRMEERYMRALADLENYRKRSEREADRRAQEMRATVLLEWLEALDSVELALRMQPDDQGLQAVLAQMEAILARDGATRVGVAGEPFDPTRHHAVAVRSSDEVPDQTILEVARSGFALDGKVLRPAQVVVSQRTSGS
jgi:molecular chaperone GrpE